MLIERRQHIMGSFRRYEAGSTQTSSIRSKELATAIITSVTASYLIDLFPFWLLFAHVHFDLIEGSSLLTLPKSQYSSLQSNTVCKAPLGMSSHSHTANERTVHVRNTYLLTQALCKTEKKCWLRGRSKPHKQINHRFRKQEQQVLYTDAINS